jgi:SAM-dependent methyltransferase
MLSMAQVTAEDRVLDLGAGDGRIAITAAKPPFGARAVGIEYDPDLAKLATCLAQVESLTDRVRIVEGDIFKEDFGDASVVTLYLLPQINLCVRHRLLAMTPGTRVVSHQYAMADWKPDQSVQILGRDVYLWVVPARVDGIWDFQDSEGTTFTFDLRQTFETLSGEITRGGVQQALLSATLRGAELRLTSDADGAAVELWGTVHGEEIGSVLRTGTVARTAVGRLRGALRGAPWAEMPAGCSRYYEWQPALQDGRRRSPTRTTRKGPTPLGWRRPASGARRAAPGRRRRPGRSRSRSRRPGRGRAARR